MKKEKEMGNKRFEAMQGEVFIFWLWRPSNKSSFQKTVNGPKKLILGVFKQKKSNYDLKLSCKNPIILIQYSKHKNKVLNDNDLLEWHTRKLD